MRFGNAAVAALALAAATGTAGAQGVRMDRNVSMAMADAIMTAAMTQCIKDGYHVSVTVLDRAGQMVAFLRGDDTPPHTVDLARRKAYTALTFKTTSEDFAKRMQGDPVRQQQATLPGVIGIPGGVPVKVGDEVIAGVGLSGSPGVDEPCVRAGLAKVEDQLK